MINSIIIHTNKVLKICCDGALVMPKNYAVVNEEEMTYVEGGIEFFNYVTSYSSGYNARSFFDRQASRLWGV